MFFNTLKQLFTKFSETNVGLTSSTKEPNDINSNIKKESIKNGDESDDINTNGNENRNAFLNKVNHLAWKFNNNCILKFEIVSKVNDYYPGDDIDATILYGDNVTPSGPRDEKNNNNNNNNNLVSFFTSIWDKIGTGINNLDVKNENKNVNISDNENENENGTDETATDAKESQEKENDEHKTEKLEKNENSENNNSINKINGLTESAETGESLAVRKTFQSKPGRIPRVPQMAAPKRPVYESYCLTLNEFYHLFLYVEDKLPEIASFIIKAMENGDNLNVNRNDNVNINSNNINGIDNFQDKHVSGTKHENDDNVAEEKKMDVSNGTSNNENESINDGDGNLWHQDNLSSDDIDRICIICFGEISNGVILGCSHAYCKDCIDTWQREEIGNQCPLCRASIAQNEMWIDIEKNEFSKTDYIKSLIQYIFDYVRLFDKWKLNQ